MRLEAFHVEAPRGQRPGESWLNITKTGGKNKPKCPKSVICSDEPQNENTLKKERDNSAVEAREGRNRVKEHFVF